MNYKAAPTPVSIPDFFAEREERLEGLATTGRGARRVAAAMMLRAETRMLATDERRAARRAREPAAFDDEPALDDASTPTEDRHITAARLSRARTKYQKPLINGRLDPEKQAAADAAWEHWVETDETQVDEHEAPQRSLRARASRALDRLAEREVERGSRLDERLWTARRHDA